MTMKILKNIEVESFAHPDDKALMKGLEKTKINHLIEWISGTNTKYSVEMNLMGRYVRVSEKDMPQLYKMLEDVCRVLDYPQIPRVFIHRSKLFDWEVYIGKEPIIVLTDFVLNDFDEGMLRFHLGCAVTALKSKTCQVRVASMLALSGAIVGSPAIGAALVPMMTGWIRAATLTEDRGGLLACQDPGAAWRYMFRLAGIPRELINEDVIHDYIAEYKPLNSVAHVSKTMQAFTRLKPWHNERIVNLYNWYTSGDYHDILEDY